MGVRLDMIVYSVPEQQHAQLALLGLFGFVRRLPPPLRPNSFRGEGAPPCAVAFRKQKGAYHKMGPADKANLLVLAAVLEHYNLPMLLATASSPPSAVLSQPQMSAADWSQGLELEQLATVEWLLLQPSGHSWQG